MKKITLSAEENLIERARRRAATDGKTLNTAFRDWLGLYVDPDTGREEYEELMKRLSHVRSTHPFSRDELNAR